MAESYSVKAVLSAVDQGFTRTMSGASNSLNSLGARVKSGIGFGALATIGGKAMTYLGSQARDLISEINETNTSWKTFTANMKMSGMSSNRIAKTKADLQDFAAKTIYSSKDMASTYAQLYAVNHKTSTALVKGFGSIAAASDNPRQAMKTISMQMTQAAAKPTIAWEDFKLMLEQSPAGIARIANAMGISTKQLVSDVKAKKVSTEDFFKAVEKAGQDTTLAGLAQSYKTVGEAMEGLRATIATGLSPAFDALNKGAISMISRAMSGLSQRMKILNAAFKGVGKAFGAAFSAIGKALNKMRGGSGSMDKFKSSAESAASAMKKLAGFMKAHAEQIAWLIKHLPQLVAAYAGLRGGLAVLKLFGKIQPKTDWITKSSKGATRTSATLQNLTKNAKGLLAAGAAILMVAAGITMLANAAIKLKSAGAGAVAVFAGMVGTMALLGVGINALVTTMSKLPASKITAVSTAFLAFGASILMCAAGMYVMASAASMLASSGTGAIAAFAVMGVVIAGLVVVFANFGAALNTAVPGMLAFGAAVLMIGVGVGAAAAGLSLLVNAFTGLAGVMPTISQYGLTTASAMVAMSAGAIALGTTLGLASIALGAYAVLAGAAAGTTVILAGTLKIVRTTLSAIKSKAASAASTIAHMSVAVNAVKSGLNTLGGIASAAMGKLKSAFSSGVNAAATAGRNIGTKFASGVKSGMSRATAAARSGIKSIHSALNSGSHGAYSAGVNIGRGLANGMASQLGYVRAIAAKLSAEADKAARKKAEVRSPSRVFMRTGAYMAEGLAIGISNNLRKVRNVSAQMINTGMPQLAGAYGGNFSLNDDYSYNAVAAYQIEVPVNLDGKQVARVTAPYTEAELNRRETRANRKKGIR